MQSKWIPVLWLAFLFGSLPGLVAYLRELSSRPSYGSGSIIAFVVATLIVLIAWRWDFKWRLPTSRLTVMFLVGGCLTASVFALGGPTWFNLVSFGCILAAFLLTQRDRRQHHRRRNLASLWCILLPLAGIPFDEHLRLLSTGQALISSWSERLLIALGIPHVMLVDGVAVSGNRIFIEDQLQTVLGWPLWLTLGMVYSAWMRRHWSVTLFNAISAFFWWMVFHCGIIILQCYSSADGDPAFRQTAISIVIFVASVLLFLSAECGCRWCLAPVSDKLSWATQKNPLLLSWNVVFTRRSAKRKRKQKASKQPLAIVQLITVLLVGNLWASQAVGLARGASTAEEQLVAASIDATTVSAFLENLGPLDYRQVRYSSRPEYGLRADIWTCYQADFTAQHVVAVQPPENLDLVKVYLQAGWHPVLPIESNRSGVTARTGGQNRRTMRLQKQGTLAQVCWVSSDAQHLGRNAEAASHVDGASFVVHSFFTFRDDPTDEVRTKAENQFAMVVNGLQTSRDSLRGVSAQSERPEHDLSFAVGDVSLQPRLENPR